MMHLKLSRWNFFFVILLMKPLRYEDEANCRAVKEISFYQNKTQSIPLPNTTDTVDELYFTLLNTESHYYISDKYSFLQPKVNASCECNCQGQCSSTSRKRDNRCNELKNVNGSCVTYYEQNKESNLCSSSHHAICCQVYFNFDENENKFVALKLDKPISYNRVRICQNVTSDQSKCKDYLIPEEIKKFLYSKNILFDLTTKMADLELPDGVWNYYYEPHGIRCFANVNERSGKDLKKVGWFQIDSKGNVIGIESVYLTRHLNLGLSTCNGDVKANEWTFTAAGSSHLEGEKFDNSYHKAFVNWSESLVIVKYERSHPLIIKPVITDVNDLAYYAIIINNETQKKHISLNLNTPKNKFGNYMLKIYNKNFRDVETMNIFLNETAQEFVHDLGLNITQPTWVSLVRAETDEEPIFFFASYIENDHLPPTTLSSTIFTEDEANLTGTSPDSSLIVTSALLIDQVAIVVAVIVVAIAITLAIIMRKGLAKIISKKFNKRNLRRNSMELNPLMVNDSEDISDEKKQKYQGYLRKIQRQLKPLYSTKNSPQTFTTDNVKSQLEYRSNDKVKKINYDKLFDKKLVKNSDAKIILVGNPGIGKTALMMKYVNDWARDSQYMKRFDLVFYLKEIHDNLETSLLGEYLFDEKKGFLEYYQHRMLIIYEISRWLTVKEKEFVFQLLNNKQFPKAKVLITCPSGEKFWFSELETETPHIIFEIRNLKKNTNIYSCIGNRQLHIPVMNSLPREISSRKRTIEKHVTEMIERIESEYGSVDLYNVTKQRHRPFFIIEFTKIIFNSWKDDKSLIQGMLTKNVSSNAKKLLDSLVNFKRNEKLQPCLLGDFIDFFVAYHLRYLGRTNPKNFETEIKSLLARGLGPSKMNYIFPYLVKMGLREDEKDILYRVLSLWSFWYCMNKYDDFGNELFGPIREMQQDKEVNCYIKYFIPPIWEIKTLSTNNFEDLKLLTDDVDPKIIQLIRFPISMGTNQSDIKTRNYNLFVNILELIFESDDFEGVRCLQYLPVDIRRTGCTRVLCYIKKFNSEKNWESFVNMVDIMNAKYVEIVISNETITFEFLKKLKEELYDGKWKEKIIKEIKCCLPEEDVATELILISRLTEKVNKLFIKRCEQATCVKTNETEANKENAVNLFRSAFESTSLIEFSTLVYRGPQIMVKLEECHLKKRWSYLEVGRNIKFAFPPNSSLYVDELEFCISFSATGEQSEKIAKEIIETVKDLHTLTSEGSFFHNLCERYPKWHGFATIKKIHLKIHSDHHEKDHFKGLKKFSSLEEIQFSFPWDHGERMEFDLEPLLEVLRTKPGKTLQFKINGDNEDQVQFLICFLESVAKDSAIVSLPLLKVNMERLENNKLKHIFELFSGLLDKKLQKLKLRYPSYLIQMHNFHESFGPHKHFTIFFEKDPEIDRTRQTEMYFDSEFEEYIVIVKNSDRFEEIH